MWCYYSCMSESRLNCASKKPYSIVWLIDTSSSSVFWKHSYDDVITWTYILHYSLQWRHNRCDGIPNYQPHDCSLNRLYRRRSKKTPKLSVTSLCVGNSPVTGEFPAQMASNAENVSIWWRHRAALCGGQKSEALTFALLLGWTSYSSNSRVVMIWYALTLM